MTSRFDDTLGQWEIVLTGTQFSTVTSAITLEIDGVAQVTKSAALGEIVFTITDVQSVTLSNMKVTFPEGTPAGHSFVDAGTTLTPKLVSISPTTGSVGGTQVTANVQGVGLGTTGIDIVDSSGTSICASVTVQSYGSVLCETKKQEINVSALKVSDGTNAYPSVTTLTYAQLTANAGSFASLTSLSKTQTTMNIGCANCNLITNPAASFSGIAADSVTVDTTTNEIIATWTDGVPLSATAAQPVVKYEDSGNTYAAIIDASVTIANAVVAPTTSATSCSFAGGCSFDITSDGLTQMLKSDPENNYVSVCENKCSVTADSSSTSTKCTLPSLSTSYSDSTLGIQSSHILLGQLSSSYITHDKLFDGDVVNYNEDWAADCHVTMQFR